MSWIHPSPLPLYCVGYIQRTKLWRVFIIQKQMQLLRYWKWIKCEIQKLSLPELYKMQLPESWSLTTSSIRWAQCLQFIILESWWVQWTQKKHKLTCTKPSIELASKSYWFPNYACVINEQKNMFPMQKLITSFILVTVIKRKRGLDFFFLAWNVAS